VIDGIRRERLVVPALHDRADPMIDLAASFDIVPAGAPGHPAPGIARLRVFVTWFAGLSRLPRGSAPGFKPPLSSCSEPRMPLPPGASAVTG
jgi:hypothetical protein